MIDTDSISPGTVNVLIGPNGSGKSRLLRKLCISFLRSGEEVIAIAPTIFDRFRYLPKKGFRFFGARQGRAAATEVVRSALERAFSDNPQVLKNLTRALAYTHFDPVIGINLSGVNLKDFSSATKHLSKNEADSLHSALLKWQSRSDKDDLPPLRSLIAYDDAVPRRNLIEYDGTVRLSMDSFSFKELDALTFGILAKHDALLRRTKMVSRIEYLLYRKGEPIPLLEACSGEICFITTIAFISTQIKRRSVIAIDEPDTSLHPTWQKNYVGTLLDLFSYYEPRIVISTHSPIIISGAEAASGKVSVYEMTNGLARKFNHAKLSLEEMYDRLFGLITPKNHYLSQRAVTMMNNLNSGEQNLNQVLGELGELREKSYDESQQTVISKFEELARKLESIKAEEGE